MDLNIRSETIEVGRINTDRQFYSVVREALILVGKAACKRFGWRGLLWILGVE